MNTGISCATIGEDMELHEGVLELLRARMRGKHGYINPHFMQKLTAAIYDYYEVEDDDIDQWILDMFGV